MSTAPFTVTFFTHHDARFKQEDSLTPGQLAERIRIAHAAAKTDLPWLKLAGFGDMQSPKGSLRHDANVRYISGIEGDYDGETLTFDAAIEALDAAGIDSIVYTSPSHTPAKPRWRVLCPLSARFVPSERNKFLARLNGVFGGALSGESFTLSQSYYFGFVDGSGSPSPQHRVEIIDGDCIDQLDWLDAGAIGKHKSAAGASAGTSNYTELDELRRRIVSGESLHPSVAAIAGKFALNNVPQQMCLDYVHSAFDDAHAARYAHRWAECETVIADIYRKEDEKRRAKAGQAPISENQFYYHSEENKCIFEPTGALWPIAAVNGRLVWVGGNKPSSRIMQDRAVEQASWCPGEPRLIRHKLVHQGGWIAHPNATVFNYYRPPPFMQGNAKNAMRWVDHVHLIYPDEAVHIIQWLAHRVQFPNIKINHALVLGGSQGIGKDTLLFPAIQAVGDWNTQTVSPVQMLEKFNGHLKSVILIVTEARDMGEINRPQFYAHLKNIIAAPPDVLYVNEKNRQQYYIPNLCGVVITTNHKADGIYLSAEDRRHFVAWSSLEMKDFGPDYFDRIWDGFYFRGGIADVATYLATLDLGGFNPKAPPPKTPAFWEIVDAGQHPETGNLEDILTSLGHPLTVTTKDLIETASFQDEDFVTTIRRNRRMLSRWMEQAGYKAVHNPSQKQGLWLIQGKNQVVYGKSDTTNKELMKDILRKKGV